jgi:hypothetical protein
MALPSTRNKWRGIPLQINALKEFSKWFEAAHRGLSRSTQAVIDCSIVIRLPGRASASSSGVWPFGTAVEHGLVELALVDTKRPKMPEAVNATLKKRWPDRRRKWSL